MGGRSVIIFAAVAVLLIGLCAVAMSRLDNGTTAAVEAATAKAEGVSAAPVTPKLEEGSFEVVEQTDAGINLLPQGQEIADQLNDPEMDASDDLLAIGEMIRIHLNTFKSIPPGGENVDIIQALTGRNDKSLAIIPPDHKVISEKGELLDRWGNPYHFHPVSRSLLEIRSAGPDGQLWNEDDVMLEGQGLDE